MELLNTNENTTKEFLDEFESIDGGFDVTNLKIKNLFESDPISRSQAKKLCTRLNQFNHIILDYEGVDWIGQGFAHQIYVVFQREYPHIKLQSINFNDDVRKMLVHVGVNEV